MQVYQRITFVHSCLHRNLVMSGYWSLKRPESLLFFTYTHKHTYIHRIYYVCISESGMPASISTCMAKTDGLGLLVCIKVYIYTHIHTHTYTYVPRARYHDIQTMHRIIRMCTYTHTPRARYSDIRNMPRIHDHVYVVNSWALFA